MVGYTEWDIIAGQTPSAAQWNVIGDNQDLFEAEFDARWDEWHALSDGATVVVNLTSGYNKFFKVTIAGTRVISFTNIPTVFPQVILIEVTQGGAGGYTLTFPAGSDTEYHEALILSPTAGHIDLIGVVISASGQYRVVHVGRDLY